MVGKHEDWVMKRGLFSHQPVHSLSPHGPRTGPNMFRPIIVAPTPVPRSEKKSSSSPSLPPSLPIMRLPLRVAKIHSWSWAPQPERMVEILVGPGGIAIERQREVAHEQSRHRPSFTRLARHHHGWFAPLQPRFVIGFRPWCPLPPGRWDARDAHYRPRAGGAYGRERARISHLSAADRLRAPDRGRS